MNKEKLEEELKQLKNKFTILSAQSQKIKGELLSLNNELLITKGAIEQTEKLLALYNTESTKDSTNNEKEE